MMFRDEHKKIRFLSKEIKFAIRKEIRQECRQEAIKILEYADDKDREDFLKYHKEGSGNVCCLVLDYAKKKLVERRVLEQKDCDCFKDPNNFLDADKK